MASLVRLHWQRCSAGAASVAAGLWRIAAASSLAPRSFRTGQGRALLGALEPPQCAPKDNQFGRRHSGPRHSTAEGAMVLSSFAAAALSLFTKKEEVVEDPVVHKLKQGILAQRKGQLDEAESLYHEALRLGAGQHERKQLDERRWLLMRINIYDLMANLALQGGKLPQAENLYKEVIKACLQHGLHPEDEAIIELSVKLASIYAMQQRREEAEQGYKFCIDASRKKIKDSDGVAGADTNVLALLGISTQGYARYLMSLKRYAEARSYFEEAHDVAAEVYGRDHPQTLVVLNDAGAAAMLAGDYASASQRFGEAVETAERRQQEEAEQRQKQQGLQVDGQPAADGGLSAFRYNLAAACMKTGDLTRAASLCTAVLQSAKESRNGSLAKQAEQCLHDVDERRQSTRDRHGS